MQSVAKTNFELGYIRFRILGSPAQVSARDNTITDPKSDGVGEPIYYMLGEKVAEDYADLYDGYWGSTEPRDENGNTFSGSLQVTTGTNPDGSSATVPYPCGPVSIAIGTGSRILIGRPTEPGWELHSVQSPPAYLYRFYALSEPLVVVSESQAIPVSMGYNPESSVSEGGST